MDNCPHCSAKVLEYPLTKYCIECGKELAINTCKNSSCIINNDQLILPDRAKYCSVCGGPTTFEDKIPF